MERKKHEIWAILLLMLALLIFFSLISFHADDRTFFNASGVPPRNWVGAVGANLSYCILVRLGLGAYALPLLGLWVGCSLFFGHPPFTQRRLQPLGIILLLACSMALSVMHQPKISLMGETILSGGELGDILAQFLIKQFYPAGAHVVLIGLLLIGFLLATPFSLRVVMQKVSQLIFSSLKGLLSLASRVISRLGRSFVTTQEETPDPQPIRVQPSPPTLVTPGVELLPPPVTPPRKKSKKGRQPNGCSC